MIELTIIPIRPARGMPQSLTLSVTDETVSINGEAFDFSPLSVGGTLPPDAIDCQLIHLPVRRDDNSDLYVTLLRPHGPRATEVERQNHTLEITEDGDVELPI